MTSKAKFYFQIFTSSGVPIYRQVIDQVKTLIASGRLEPGEFLPSVRQVARDLEVNPMTVSKAYSYLEKEHVLEFVRGQGMRARQPSLSRKDLDSRKSEMVPLLREVINRAAQLSLGKTRVLRLMDSLWKEDREIREGENDA